MIEKLTNAAYQKYSSGGGVDIEILYNTSHDFFYFNAYAYGTLVSGDTMIVNGYEDAIVSFSSETEDEARAENVSLFSIEIKDVI